MKIQLLSTMLFFLFIINGFAQVDINVNLGVGVTTPQLVNSKDYGVVEGKVTPILGLYSSLVYKRFELLSGIESSSSKDKRYFTNLKDDHNYNYESKTELSKLSIPLTIGYEVEVANLKFKPYVGILHHLNVKLNEGIATEKVYNKLTETTDNVYDLNDKYSKKSIDKTQYLTGLILKISRKLSIDLSIALGKNISTSFYPHAYEYGFDPRFAPINCGPGERAEIKGNNYRLTFNYNLTK